VTLNVSRGAGRRAALFYDAAVADVSCGGAWRQNAEVTSTIPAAFSCLLTRLFCLLLTAVLCLCLYTCRYAMLSRCHLRYLPALYLILPSAGA